jgi:hypothetical protein
MGSLAIIEYTTVKLLIQILIAIVIAHHTSFILTTIL